MTMAAVAAAVPSSHTQRSKAVDATTTRMDPQEEGKEELTGERLLFWIAAKELCRERRRERKVQAGQARRQSLQRVLVPTEIGVSLGNNQDNASHAITTIQEEDLLLPSTHGKPAEEDANSDDGSCVSDVTRELPDLFESKMYPSLSCFDDAEAPDLNLSKRSLNGSFPPGKKFNTADNDPVDQLLSLRNSTFPVRNVSPIQPVIGNTPVVTRPPTAERLSITNESPFLSEGPKLSTKFKELRDSSHYSQSDTKTKASIENTNKKNRLPTSMMESLTLKNSIMTSNFFLNKRSDVQLKRSSFTLPAVPQRRLSLDSQQNSNPRIEESSRNRRRHSDVKESYRAPAERRVSTSSPVLPKRRLSLDSQIHDSGDILDQLEYEGIYDEGKGTNTPVRSIHRPVFQDFLLQKDAPSREELGYDISADCGLPPQCPCRRHSFSSAMDHDNDNSTIATSWLHQDDNSTIATWTLGLYRRRKSLDSTVAAPLATPNNAGRYDDAPPARPRRRFSASSFAA